MVSVSLRSLFILLALLDLARSILRFFSVLLQVAKFHMLKETLCDSAPPSFRDPLFVLHLHLVVLDPCACFTFEYHCFVSMFNCFITINIKYLFKVVLAVSFILG